MKVRAVVSAAHNWLGLALGLQFFLWMASGAAMSLFDIELVRGRTNALKGPAPTLEVRGYANPGGVLAQIEDATSVTLRHALGRPAYLVSSRSGSALFDAQTAERLSPIPEEAAQRIAEQDFVGAGALASGTLLSAAPHECGCRAPVWRFQFDDRLHTRIYVSPETAEVIARRNDIWRIYDFFWMLHILDFKERSDFNNPLLRTASVTGVLFAITGIYLVIIRLLRGQYRIRRESRSRNDRPDVEPRA